MKQLNKKVIIVTLTTTIIAFFLIGYFVLENTLDTGTAITHNEREFPLNQNRIAHNTDYLELVFLPIQEEDMSGGIGGIIAESEFGGEIYLETPQDVFHIYVANGMQDSVNLILKIFYNFQEVAFQVLGSNEPSTEFLFNLERAYEVYIPVQLPETLDAIDTISKLTIDFY